MLKKPASVASILGSVVPNSNAPGPAPAASGAQPAQHLHFGGSLSATNFRVNGSPKSGVPFRTQKRFELIIQLENAQMPDHAIAAMICISVQRLRYLKRSVEYLIARNKLTYGIVVDHEAKLSEIKAQRKEMLTAMLPEALQVIANAVREPGMTLADKRFRVSVAQDILDREGSYAKISRAEIKPVTNFSYETTDESANSVLAVARASNNRSTDDIAEVIEISKQFSESRTIDVKQQQTLIEELDDEILRRIPPGSERLQ